MKITNQARSRNLPKQLLRLGAASCVNSMLGVLSIGLLYHLTKSSFMAIGLATVLGYIYSVYSYNYIGFGHGFSNPPFVRYAIVYASGFLFNICLTSIGFMFTDRFLIVQIFVLPAVVGIQWIASYFWAFRIKK